MLSSFSVKGKVSCRFLLSEVKQITNLGNNFHISRRDIIDGSLNQVTNEQSFNHINNIGNNKVKNGQCAQESGNNHFSADLERRKNISC